jgi:hypothetical protein
MMPRTIRTMPSDTSRALCNGVPKIRKKSISKVAWVRDHAQPADSLIPG